jgi:hypothetical protein
MKTRKAPGIDNVSTELIQNVGIKIQNELVKLVNDIYYNWRNTRRLKKKKILITPPKKATAEKYN